MLERRSLRSHRPDLATRHFMLAVTRRHQPWALVLADMRGRMIAGVEGRRFMETAFIATRADEKRGDALARAALEEAAPRLGPGRLERLRGLWGRREEATVRRSTALRTRRGPYLVVVEGPESICDAALEEASGGLARILDR